MRSDESGEVEAKPRPAGFSGARRSREIPVGTGVAAGREEKRGDHRVHARKSRG